MKPLRMLFNPLELSLKKIHFTLRGIGINFILKMTSLSVLELGCGKGEYTIHLASLNPQKNFIGIDIKGARFWRGAKNALKDKMNNVAFVRAQIELIDKLFAPQEVKEVWITFPDPQIKFKRTKHRLTNPSFWNAIERYFLKMG